MFHWIDSPHRPEVSEKVWLRRVWWNRPGSPGDVFRHAHTASRCPRQPQKSATIIFLWGYIMPEYVIEREIPGAGNLSELELQAIARKSLNVLKGMGPEIKWLHSYVTGDKVYCVYLAPDEETIREHARRGGFPANRVSAVRRLINPNTANG